jgi:RecA-family ATPase
MTIVAPLRGGDTPLGDVEVEQALLGAILTNNRAYCRVSDFLRPEHFSSPVHGRIYAAIGELVEQGREANPIILKNLFDRDGALVDVGGAQYLARLVEATVTIINAEHYGRTIRDLHLRRELIVLGEDIAAAAHLADPARGASAIVHDYARRLEEIDARESNALGFTIASSLSGVAIPERVWTVGYWIPAREVTLLTGDGGTGKTLLSQQLLVAAASGRSWLGLPTRRCRAIGFFAEDDAEELHRRLHAIARASGVELAELDRLAVRSTLGEICELVEFDDAGRVRSTGYWHQVRAAVRRFGAQLVVLDAATNFFGGNEVNRREVNGFLTLLRRLAIEIDGAVVLIAHPSLQGISSGSGLSGSTHWNNGVRSRLYFVRTAGDDADPDERTLARMKANYAAAGDVIRARYVDGAFMALDPPSGIDRAALSAKADRVFLSLLTESYGAGLWVSASPTANNYAPTRFAKHPDREGLNKAAFETAMYRLKKAGQIKIEQYGRPAEPRSRLAPG